MWDLSIALSILATTAPAASPSAKANWIDIAKSADGSLLRLDAGTHQKSGFQHAVWLRLERPVSDARGVKTSTSLVWLNCKDRTYNLMVHHEANAQGERIDQHIYGDRGRGFEKVKTGTAVANAQFVVCG